MPTKKVQKTDDLDANELADAIVEKRIRSERKAYEVFRKKCRGAISVMAAQEKDSVTIDLDDEDMLALGKVTEELRDLGYKFRYTEKITVNEDGEELDVKHSLFVSLKHLL